MKVKRSQVIVGSLALFALFVAILTVARIQTASAQVTSRRLVAPSPYRLLSYDEGIDTTRAVMFVPDETDPQDDILTIENLARSITRQGRAFDLTVCTAPKPDAPFQDAFYCRGEFFFDVRR